MLIAVGLGKYFQASFGEKFSPMRLLLSNCGLKMPESPRAISFTPLGKNLSMKSDYLYSAFYFASIRESASHANELTV